MCRRALPIGGALLIAACGASGSDTPAPVAQSPSRDVEVIDCSFGKPAVRPAAMILACADLGARLDQLAWTSWTADRAEGDGIERDKTCVPDCATGSSVTKPVHVVLSEPIEPGHVFTKATVVDADGKATSWPLTRR